MNDKEKGILIDKHYKEEYKEDSLNNIALYEINRFENSLKNIDKKMHVPENNNAANVDFFSIIQKAETIKKEKKQKKENLCFLFTALTLLFILCATTFLLGTKFIIYFEVIISFFSIIFTVFITKYYIKEKKL